MSPTAPTATGKGGKVEEEEEEEKKTKNASWVKNNPCHVHGVSVLSTLMTCTYSGDEEEEDEATYHHTDIHSEGEMGIFPFLGVLTEA